MVRFENQVKAAVAKADPKAAREREERAREGDVREKLRNEAFGMGYYLVRAPLPVIDQIAGGHRAYSEAIRDQFPDSPMTSVTCRRS